MPEPELEDDWPLAQLLMYRQEPVREQTPLDAARAAEAVRRMQYAGQYAKYKGMEPGNLDLEHRPAYRNPDGSISSVRSMGVNLGGKEYLLPTIADDGRSLNDDEAIEEFRRTGQHLGVYRSPEDSTRAAEAIHEDQAAMMSRLPSWLQFWR